MSDCSRITGYIFYDIETAPGYSSYEDLSVHEPNLADAWDYLRSHRKGWENLTNEESYQQHSGLLAEFNKIVCISTGRVVGGDGFETKIRSFSTPRGESEESTIRKFLGAITDGGHQDKKLCGFNINGFDTPVIIRKAIRYGIPLPPQFKTWNRKPWDSMTFDIMDAWKFGSYGSNVSLNTLSVYFGIPTPKMNMSGADVGRYYWSGDEYLKDIVHYCEGDVRATMDIMRKLLLSGLG